jgi:hypothetical protein
MNCLPELYGIHKCPLSKSLERNSARADEALLTLSVGQYHAGMNASRKISYSVVALGNRFCWLFNRML